MSHPLQTFSSYLVRRAESYRTFSDQYFQSQINALSDPTSSLQPVLTVGIAGASGDGGGAVVTTAASVASELVRP